MKEGAENRRRCPFCNSRRSEVIDVRCKGDKTRNWRRLRCPDCLKRWSTYEKWNGVRDPYRKRTDKGASEEFYGYSSRRTAREILEEVTKA